MRTNKISLNFSSFKSTRLLFKLILFCLYFATGIAAQAQEKTGEVANETKYYYFTTPLPDHPGGYWLVPKPYLTDLTPGEAPVLSGNPVLSTFATPGESEPVTFVIYATKDLKNINISSTNLTGGGNTISANNLKIRTVMRAPQRENYWSPADKYVITNRFLPEFKSFDLPARHLREIWITIDIPENTPKGIYTGFIQVSPENGIFRNLPLSLEVLPFTLKIPASKKYGYYYSILL